MKKLSIIFAAAFLLLTGCGSADDATESSLQSADLLPNLVVQPQNFKCGNSFVVVEVKNIGTADAASSFVSASQADGSNARHVGVKALKKGEAVRTSITVVNGKKDVILKADVNGTVRELNENDNTVRIPCG